MPLTFAEWRERTDLECSVGMAEVVWNAAMEQAQEAIAARLLRVPAVVADAGTAELRHREVCGLEVIAAIRELRTDA